TPIGYILSLEGADSMVTLDHVERSYEQGLRAIGPAHYGPGTYAQGTDATGGIGQKGRELLTEMERLNIILDATHLCDESFREAMDHFKGKVWASHSNCRALVPDKRQFTDDQMKELIERGAVIGAALDAWMLVPNWIKKKSTVEELHPMLEHTVDIIDHVCQLAGNSEHSAIGTDLDGGFGTEQSPQDLDTIADLQKIFPMLEAKGYDQEAIENIAFKNWIRFLENAWS
ncbi:MAG: membrane dipeptidase, partial [Verrucomicrobia bacterium]|nr:membrane dipeptidase [Verrucomicrobiota bacterium]